MTKVQLDGGLRCARAGGAPRAVRYAGGLSQPYILVRADTRRELVHVGVHRYRPHQSSAPHAGKRGRGGALMRKLLSVI